jgi:hypothetical protein
MDAKKTARPKSAACVPLHQLKVTLKWSRPAIWRRVVVPADLTLDRLHHVIQIAMGWTNCHLHQFIGDGGRFDGGAFRERDPDFDASDDDAASEEDHTVADLAPRSKSKFVYEYDFGDSWLHDVKVEKVLAPDPAFKHPVCLAGKNACPPEDCGGIGGYYDMLKSLADPKRPEHEEVKEWLGGDWDAARFDVDRINAALKRFKR